MKKLFSFAAPRPLFLVLAGTVLFIGNANADLLLYDGFDYPSGQLLAPTDGSAGQFNSVANNNWYYAGNVSANQNPPGIASSGLHYSDVSAPGYSGLADKGNSILYDNSQSGTARIQLTTDKITASTTEGMTYFYSGLVRVNDLANLTVNLNGLFFASFNNSVGTGGQPAQGSALTRLRVDGDDNSKFNLGIAKTTGTAAGTIAYSGPLDVGETLFIVASYEFVAGTANDVVSLWINPDPTTFGNTAPSATLSTAPGIADQDLWSIDLKQVNSVGNPAIQLDELRAGTSWADVTTVPEPSAGIFGSFIAVAFLSWRRFRKP